MKAGQIVGNKKILSIEMSTGKIVYGKVLCLICGRSRLMRLDNLKRAKQCNDCKMEQEHVKRLGRYK